MTTQNNTINFNEEDYLAMMDGVGDEIMPADPWTPEHLDEVFKHLEGLLANSPLTEELQVNIRNIIVLSHQLRHPEIIDADFLGYSTAAIVFLMQQAGNSAEEGIMEILTELSKAFNAVITQENEHFDSMIMMVRDINYNYNSSVFSNPLEQKHNSQIDYLGKLSIISFDILTITEDQL